MSANGDTEIEERSRRGRPPRISRDRVVGAALDIGLERFSMDDVAERLGVTTPALYTHVSGRDEIVRLGAGVVIERGSAAAEEWTDWESWLRGWTTSLRGDLGAIGGELLDAVRDGLEVGHLEVVERGIGLLIEAGLGPSEAGHTLWLAARIAMSAGPSGTSPVAAVAAAARSTALESATSAASGTMTPAMASAIDAMTDVDNDEAFAFDLDVLVAGVEARLVA